MNAPTKASVLALPLALLCAACGGAGTRPVGFEAALPPPPAPVVHVKFTPFSAMSASTMLRDHRGPVTPIAEPP